MTAFPPVGPAPAPENGNGAGLGGGAHLDFLRARHEAITADRFLDCEVPGYQGHLVVRYGRVPWAAVAKAAHMMENPGRDGEGLLLAQVDFLIAACREVMFREEGGELVPVDPSGDVRRFDPELAELFQFEATSARETLRYVFGNDLAVAVQAGRVLTWSQNTDTEADDDFLGESEPAVK